MKNVLKKIGKAAAGEAVLAAAILLAVASAFFVPPDRKYLSYIDFDTLALLFALMAVTKGFQKCGLFNSLSQLLLGKVRTTAAVSAVLVFLPFFFSMFITNDVSLITFVPFAITVLNAAGEKRLVVPVVVLQTAAANLGSMLTPMGNPQNLYLYNRSGMGFFELCGIMLPYVAVSAVMLAAGILFMKSRPVKLEKSECAEIDKKGLSVTLIGFFVSMLSVVKLVSPIVPAAAIAVFLVIFDRKILRQIDYSLLLTFVGFFVFIGNMGRIEAFRSFISSVVSGNERGVAILSSQLISNVPAALLLSGFTDNLKELIVGCNLGGLGTLIASMASLISYKLVAKEYPALKGKYFKLFTVSNFAMLAVLSALGILI